MEKWYFVYLLIFFSFQSLYLIILAQGKCYTFQITLTSCCSVHIILYPVIILYAHLTAEKKARTNDWYNFNRVVVNSCFASPKCNPYSKLLFKYGLVVCPCPVPCIFCLLFLFLLWNSQSEHLFKQKRKLCFVRPVLRDFVLLSRCDTADQKKTTLLFSHQTIFKLNTEQRFHWNKRCSHTKK